jgi:exonuclease SbcD
MKFIYFGDPHIRGKNPRNRTDDYKEALKAKFREIWKLAEYNKATAILCPGDIFDRPEVTNGVLLEFAEVFKESPVPIYTTAGNHDVYSYNLDTYGRTSLRILELIVPQLTVTNDPKQNVILEDKDSLVSISFQPYDQNIDRDGYGYSPGDPVEEAYMIHVAHGMLLDHDPKVFDRYTYVKTAETEADLVLCGHDHLGFGRYDRADGKVFYNGGSLTRLSASEAEQSRKINVALITIEDSKLKSLEEIELRSAKPGIEILDRSQIEADQKRQYAMEEFAALIQSEDGTQAIVDLDSIVAAIAAKEGYAPEVVEKALEKISLAKQDLKV